MIFHFFYLSSDMVTSIRIRRIIILWGWKGSRETKCIQGLSTLGSALVTRVPTDWCRSPPSNLRTHPCIYLFVYFPLNTMIYCIYMFHYLFFNLLLWFQSWPNFILARVWLENSMEEKKRKLGERILRSGALHPVSLLRSLSSTSVLLCGPAI